MAVNGCMDDLRRHDQEPTTGFVVRGPRRTDAIGSALRGAFGSRPELPGDIRLALERLGTVAF